MDEDTVAVDLNEERSATDALLLRALCAIMSALSCDESLRRDKEGESVEVERSAEATDSTDGSQAGGEQQRSASMVSFIQQTMCGGRETNNLRPSCCVYRLTQRLSISG